MGLNVLYDHSDVIIDLIPVAIDAGLVAMAYVFANEVKRALAGGYTSGAFVTGHVMNSVTVGEPYASGDGERAVAVGTDVEYALFWEVGHFNIFTRHYERVEIWGPARDAMAPEMADVFQGTVASYLAQGAP